MRADSAASDLLAIG